MNSKLLRQAQELQKRLARVQQELEQATVQASSGGGVVTVVMTGKFKIKELKISPEALESRDPELLADLVTAAVNEALDKVQSLAAQRLGSGLPF